MRSVAVGGAASVAAAVAVLGVFALLIAGGAIPERFLDGCVSLACFVGGLVGSRVVTGNAEGRRILTGVAVGTLAAAVQGVTGVLLYSELEICRCAMVAVSYVLGGVLAAMPGRERRKKRR